MKYWILLGVVSLAACDYKTGSTTEAVPQDTQENIIKDSLNIVTNFKKQQDCWNSNDLECYMTAYHPENHIQTISRLGVTHGYETILGTYKKYYPADRMGELSFDSLNLKRLSADYYYVYGRFNLFYKQLDTTFSGWFSVLMEEYQNNWYIISDHSS